ncbi:MAG TPA: 16S rRNA (cytosine(1402)-N(4))-methyltransferase RsmH, partial [Acidimicrobiales bacterium]|nr:16S rRNA (cytosine(1402)-N(4))-methyltransferase RsmH [Acidimicrobiales bacterium]
QHQPVMASEVVELFAPVGPGVVLDATVGLGGHASALLAAHPGLGILGIDRDPLALEAAAVRLARFGDRVVLQHARFSELARVVGEARAAGRGRWPSSGEASRAPETISGALFDLGVSSLQLDTPDRGFSYRADGPLDMRMDPGDPVSALELVNEAPPSELATWFRASGETRLAGRIARAVEAARPITTTAELAGVVEAAVPAPARRRGHPASRVFQALRIAVNDEAGELEAGLSAALELLGPGARCVVLAYHSGEGRLVRNLLSEAVSGGCVCPPGLPCTCGAVSSYRTVFRGSRGPGAAEVSVNARASSARLWAVERLGDRGAGGP